MHGALKRVALRALTQDAIAALFEPLTRGHAAIFYLHRFAESSAGLARHEPAHLRATLSYLRRRRFSVLPLTTLLERLAAGAPVRKALAFTVDDGYEDFHSQAAPVFAEFDCPVTVFLTTGFLDGQLWLWWDRVEYAFNRTTRRSVALDWGGRVRTFGWDGAEGAEACRLEIDEFLKSMRYGERLAAIDKLAEQLGVPLPASPPPEYAPMSWDAVRADARRGVTFGPHSVTHPILARVDAQRSGWEIEQSWNRVRAETDACVPVFCYPNGDPGSFGEREIATVRQLGLRAALTTIEGYATAQLFRRERPNARYAIPRFSYPETAPHFIQVVSGIERARSVVPVAIPRASRLDSEPVVLMVAYHFAPDNASGTHRSLHFARSLDLAGHTPCVLTTSLDALRSVDPALNDLFPFPERVLRVKPAGTLGDGYRALKDWWQRHAGRTRQPRGVTAANTSEPPNSHLSSVRRHLRTWDGFPDSHRAWYRPAVQAGMELRARHSVVAVYASGPPWTGLRVGATLARRFGCPFVADFRDPWTVQIGQNVVYDAKWAESMAARWEIGRAHV
jgi:peptidoglycan/xylan/chitin deacetylase (PgdA/CDA1 family)